MTLRKDRRLDPVMLGLLAGLAGLARIDFGVIFGFYLLWLLKDRRLRLGGAFGAGLIALLITSPWFIWIYTQTGTWLPSSAGAESGFITSGDALLRLKRMATALLWNVTPWISSWDWEMRFAWAAIVLAVFLASILRPALRSLRAGAVLTDRWAVRQLAAWAVCIAALIPVYLLGFWTWHFYGRFTAPLLVVAIPAIALLATLAGTQLKPLPAVMLALSPTFFVVLACLQMHSGHMTLDLPINAGFVRDQIGDKRLVGAGQSGTVGFFNQNVINLDGKIDHQARYSMTHGGIRTVHHHGTH